VRVFSTLEAHSVLAEQVIRAAYLAAVRETERGFPRPEGDLIVVALGRLGTREFDVASDADLGFLYRGGDPEARLFWTRVAERLIEIISAYTGEGSIFSIDTRLRPRGREGELVEGEHAFVQYFQSAAEPWEALSYMKSRVVAGDIEEGTALLLRVQSRIGTRFGRGPEAAGQLVEMRKRLEALADPHNCLKTAPGGYYDIDFILTYLRLQASDVFFKSLTTPERLRVVHEWMGQLRSDQAQTLLEGAVFLRALEHALRVSSGRSDAEIPPPGPRSEPLQRLAARWLPPSLRDRPLHEALDTVTAGVRRVFREVFG
jgi:glutamate-ammonia-ligase adenylyltransferase